jgi:hypothetical protein
MVKREIRIKQQKRTRTVPAQLEEITFPAVQWVLKDWGAWTRSLPIMRDPECALNQTYLPEEWYITDDQAFMIEQELKKLERKNSFIAKCLTSYYLVRNATVADVTSLTGISQTKIRSSLRVGEAWIHCAAHSWVEPLYKDYLDWEKEKARRKKIIDALRAQEV